MHTHLEYFEAINVRNISMNQNRVISRMYFMREKRQGTKEQVHSVTDPSPWTLQSIEIDKRSDDNFRQSFTGAGATIQGVKMRNRFPGLLPEGSCLGC